MNDITPVWITNLHYWRDYPIPLNHLSQPTNSFVRTINRKIEFMGELIMPKNASRPQTNNTFVPVVFVNFKMPKEHELLFAEWFQRKGEATALDIASFISEGNKIGITWDSNNNCWIVSATCKRPGHENENHCMTSRSDDWYEALAMCAYKDRVIAKSGSWSDQQENSNWG